MSPHESSADTLCCEWICHIRHCILCQRRTIEKRSEPWTLNPVCEFLQDIFIFQWCFLQLPSSEPTHTCPCGAVFPFFLHLLFLPLLHSLNSICYGILLLLLSCHPTLQVFVQLQFILYHHWLVSPMSLPLLPLPTPCSLLSPPCLFLFSWKLERVPG